MKYLGDNALEDAITPYTVAFLVEPIQGEAGIIMPPPGYLREVRRICSARGIAMITEKRKPDSSLSSASTQKGNAYP